MEAEPEMFGAALAAPESSTYGAPVRAATRSERLTWSSLPFEAVPVPEAPATAGGAETSGARRSKSAAGRAVVGTIALLQVVWWALLGYTALQLFAL